MPARLELPDKEIVRLKEKGLSFKEIKEVLGLTCHVDTIRRHYMLYKPEEVLIEVTEDREESVWQRIKNWFKRF
jgi:DNA-binding transcriptional MerR regulator